MTVSERPDPFFLGEHRALDFLNTIATPKAAEIEWLATGHDLLDWLIEAQLYEQSDLEHLRMGAHTAALDTALHHARAFREEFRDFIAEASGSTELPMSHPMIMRINALLKAGKQHLSVTIGPEGQHKSHPAATSAVLKTVYACDTPEDLLPRIAAACAHLICEADFTYVRNCEGPTCSLYFLDVSKNHKRRWCSMEVCGNRAKAAAYRKR